MIIKSKLRPFYYWFSVVSLYGAIISLLFLVSICYSKGPIAGLVLLYSLLPFLILIMGGNLYNANKIFIDTDSKTVSFKNRFTRKVSTYKLSEFDGKLISYERIKFETVKNLFLIKDRKAIYKISSMYYSNQGEIESYFIEVPSLGKFNYYSLKTWKIKLGLPITK